MKFCNYIFEIKKEKYWFLIKITKVYLKVIEKIKVLIFNYFFRQITCVFKKNNITLSFEILWI